MSIQEEIQVLANQLKDQLQQKINARISEMQNDNNAHYLIYRVLGVSAAQGQLIDEYQNQGRFLYNLAGNFLERVTLLCFKATFPSSGRICIPNTRSQKPRNFEIDCLIDHDAIEIKWRDATTDGDHITKEHTRIQVIRDAGYIPVRVMFFYPNRDQAIRKQHVLQALYRDVCGQYYQGDDAWDYVKHRTQIDLKSILENIAAERESDMR